MANKFFSIKDVPGNTGVKVKSIRKRVDPLESYTPGKPDCEKCGMFKKCKNPYMYYTGQGKKEILIIGEHPSVDEDSSGLPFTGRNATHLEDMLKKHTVHMKEDCWLMYANCCTPEQDRVTLRMKKVTTKQIRCCRPLVMDTINKLKPKFIWMLGNNALISLLDGREKNLTVTRWERLLIPDQFFKTYIISMYSPNFLYKYYDGRYEIDKGLNNVFDKQIDFAVDSYRARKIPDNELFKKNVTLVYEYRNVINLLYRVFEDINLIAFDYETTGKKPYRPGHRIESISLAFEEEGINKAYAFAFQRKGTWSEKQYQDILELWTWILEEPDIKKVAHNAKYEDLWTRVLLDVKIQGWHACTMNTAHILDSRQKFCALKFQTYINWGIEGYDWGIKQFLEVKPGEEFNRIDEVLLPDLLEYGAYDSLFTKMLYDKQTFTLSRTRGLKKANDFWFNGIKTFMKIEEHGLRVNEDYYRRMDNRLTKRIINLEDQLHNSMEVKEFAKVTGREINFKSNKDMVYLLFDLLGLKSSKETKGGNKSVDAEALTSLKHPFVEKLLDKKRLDKIKGTYLAQFIRELYNDELHPNFHLHTARTYRSSSSEPNLQNIPVRDEEAKSMCRNGIIASEDNRIAEIDYKALEVSIAACYTQDPVLIDYLNNPATDMHRDQAMDIFMLPEKEVHKDIRFHAKNGFVFPQFYGSWYKSCAVNLWPVIPELKLNNGMSLKEHMRSKDLYNFSIFEEHLKGVESDFWNKYRVFKKWQTKILSDYSSKGYVEMFFGHRRGGYLSKNEVINAPIQGTGFHCLLWTLIKTQEICEVEGWESKIIGQIHDSILLDLVPAEQNDVISTIKTIGCEKIKRDHKWIIVPLGMDVEFSPINSSWYKKKEVKEDKYGQWVDDDGQIYNEEY